MSPRTQALLLSLALILGLGGWYSSRPGEFAMFSPGPTVNLLGEHRGDQILQVSGHRAYRDDGELRLVTIRTSRPEDRVGLFRAMQGWLNPKVDVYPYRGIYQPTDTNKSTRELSVQQMTSSKDAAIAAALSEMKIDFEEYVGINAVTEGGPSDGVLRAGDQILSVDGLKPTRTGQVVERVQAKKPGQSVAVVVSRDGKRTTERVTTEPLGTTGAAAGQSRIGVTIGLTFDFPFEVKVTLDEAIGGPSAGLMFALSIVDVLTPGSLTGGKAIAGTGEITPDGTVGSIGGVQQKIMGAQDDGAELFLVPADNCAEAAQASYDEDRIRLVRVATLEEAKRAVETWVDDPQADLPRCTADEKGE